MPDPRIVRLAESGKPIKKGDVVVEFDAAQQEQTYLERYTSVRTADSEIVQTKASHRMADETDGMNLMTSQYNLERAKLEASKAEILSEIEGAKNRIDVRHLRRRTGPGQDHHQGARLHAGGRPGAAGAAQGQNRPRHGPGQGLPVEDGDQAPNDGIVNVCPTSGRGFLRLRAAAFQRGRPGLDGRCDRRRSRTCRRCASS